MSWQYSDAPSHIAPEVGANLLTGGGPWSGVALEPGAVYALSVEVNAPGETTVGWGVTATDGSGGEYVLADPANAETVPGGQWVTVTRNLPAPAFPTTATIELVAPTDTQTRNPAMGVRTGRTVLTVPGDVLAENIMASGGIVAGTPDGARVELTDEGLVAYDATGTETAQIQGEGGEFVGGSFRTSDALPGQVTLADDGYVDMGSGNRYPGIGVTPLDTSATLRNPGIGPNINGMVLSGGQGANGNQVYSILAPNAAQTIWRGNIGDRSVLSASPRVAEIWADDAEGSRGYVTATPLSGAAVARDTAGVVSMVGADTTRAMLYTRAGGTERSLVVDDSGTWVTTGDTSYNLEVTATMSAPEIVPATGSNGWSSDGSPTGGIIVTHSTTGRVCTARLRITRTGDPVTFGAPYQTIGSAPGSATMWIPPELRIPATDYFDIRIPVSQPATGILFADLSTGEFRVKADTSATINTGQYITVNMTWFIPN